MTAQEEFNQMFDNMYPIDTLGNQPVMREAFREVSWNIHKAQLLTAKTKYHFAFSSGQYEDYSIGKMYSCDHEVLESEWDEFATVYLTERNKLYDVKDYVWTNIQKWENDNDPELAFVKLHNMINIDYTELYLSNH